MLGYSHLPIVNINGPIMANCVIRLSIEGRRHPSKQLSDYFQIFIGPRHLIYLRAVRPPNKQARSKHLQFI